MAQAKAKTAPKAAPKKATATGKKVKITQLRSAAGRLDNQEATLIGLGLNKRHKSRVLVDTPEVRGMIRTVAHLVVVEEINE